MATLLSRLLARRRTSRNIRRFTTEWAAGARKGSRENVQGVSTKEVGKVSNAAGRVTKFNFGGHFMTIQAAVVLALIVGIAIGAAVFYLVQQTRTRRLQQRFGPEYSRVLEETGNRSTAEQRLEDRQRRVQKLHIRQLDANERVRFQEGWRDIQAHFVDDPNRALSEADGLIGEVMSIEGYPMREFEERAADISVDHPIVTENYREGHRIATRNVQGRATTEDLRKAMIHYRTLFEELIGQREFVQTERTRS